MRRGEVGDDLLFAAERNDQRRLGAGVAQVQVAHRADARGIGALRGERRGRLVRQPVGKLAQFRHGVLFERNFDGLFAHDRLVSKSHAIGRQHAGERMDEHRLHAEGIGHHAGMLAGGAAEALQREACRVMALLYRHLLDGIRHVGDRDPQEALGHLVRGARLAGGLGDLIGKSRKLFRDDLGIQRRIAVGAEDRREMPRLDLSHADIGVGHGQRPASAIARGSRISARRVRPDAVPCAVKMQDGAAARRHGVDRHHRRAHAHAGDRGLERTLETAGVQRDIGRRAAHVEADDLVEPRHRRGACRADDAAGRTGEDRVLALESGGIRQSAVRLHEVEAHAGEFRRHLVDVATQDRREIRIDHGRVATRNQPQQRADDMAGGDLREADLARDVREAAFMLRILPGVHQHDGAGGDALGARRGERVPRGMFVQRFDLLAIDADASGNLHNLLVQHRRQGNGEIEQPRPGLVADPQRVGEAAVHHQQRALALAFEQRVGGNGGAHLHRFDGARRDRRIERNTKHRLDAGNGGVAVAAGILAEQLVGREMSVGMARDDVGERAATIDPELPLGRCHRTTLPLPLREGAGGRGREAGEAPSPQPPPAWGGGASISQPLRPPRQFPQLRIAQLVRQRGGDRLEQPLALLRRRRLRIADHAR